MKKVVKSMSALNAQALANGATVTNKSGQQFNASRKKKSIVKKVAEKKKVEQGELIVNAVEQNTSELKMVLEGLKDQIAMIKLDHPEQVTAWDFDFIRDKNDILLSIKARVPITNKKIH